MRTHAQRAFTLVELLVSVAVVAVLIGMLAPALASARRGAMATGCLANMRSLQMAHLLYVGEHGGWMLGTSHGVSWITALDGYSDRLAGRSPVDSSPHFDTREPTTKQLRRTSYAINFYLSPDSTRDGAVGKYARVPRPSLTVHGVMKAFLGSGAVQDHVHPWLWPSALGATNTLINAASEIEIGAHGPFATDARASITFDARSTYGFLDGHAAVQQFRAVYTDRLTNRFDPRVAR